MQQAIPQQIRDVLSRLHAGGFPSAIVAGGAIRDHIFGKPIKDIDVFVSWEDYRSPNRLGIGTVLRRNCVLENWSDYTDIPDIEKVYSVVPLAQELPVQIIVMNEGLSPVERVNQLDWGFCQVGFDGTTLNISDSFIEDAQNKTITLVHCENQHEFDRSMIRYERLKLKYPEFKLVIPEEYRKYLQPEAEAVYGYTS